MSALVDTQVQAPQRPNGNGRQPGSNGGGGERPPSRRQIGRDVWISPQLRSQVRAELDAIERGQPLISRDNVTLPPTGLCERRWHSQWGVRWICTRETGHEGDCEARGRDGIARAVRPVTPGVNYHGVYDRAVAPADPDDVHDIHGCLDAPVEVQP